MSLDIGGDLMGESEELSLGCHLLGGVSDSMGHKRSTVLEAERTVATCYG